MTTPEPSPLSEQELRTLEEYTQSLVCCVCDGPDADGDHDDDCQAPFWQTVSRATAQARAASPSPWQPIETAPHNRPVLVSYINALGNRRTVKATYYDPGMLAMADDGDVDDADENGNNVHGGWFEESEEIEACALLSCAPTHWQPLPAPPAQDGGRRT